VTIRVYSICLVEHRMKQLLGCYSWLYVSLQNGLQNHANMTLEIFSLVLGAHLIFKIHK